MFRLQINKLCHLLIILTVFTQNIKKIKVASIYAL